MIRAVNTPIAGAAGNCINDIATLTVLTFEEAPIAPAIANTTNEKIDGSADPRYVNFDEDVLVSCNYVSSDKDTETTCILGCRSFCA